MICHLCDAVSQTEWEPHTKFINWVTRCFLNSSDRSLGVAGSSPRLSLCLKDYPGVIEPLYDYRVKNGQLDIFIQNI